jgi:hypothetical protein
MEKIKGLQNLAYQLGLDEGTHVKFLYMYVHKMQNQIPVDIMFLSYLHAAQLIFLKIKTSILILISLQVCALWDKTIFQGTIFFKTWFYPLLRKVNLLKKHTLYLLKFFTLWFFYGNLIWNGKNTNHQIRLVKM